MFYFFIFDPASRQKKEEKNSNNRLCWGVEPRTSCSGGRRTSTVLQSLQKGGEPLQKSLGKKKKKTEKKREKPIKEKEKKSKPMMTSL